MPLTFDSFMPIPARRLRPLVRGDEIPGRCAPKTGPPVTGPETFGAEALEPPRPGRRCGVGGDVPPASLVEGDDDLDERDAWNYTTKSVLVPGNGIAKEVGFGGWRGDGTAFIFACIPAGNMGILPVLLPLELICLGRGPAAVPLAA